MVVNILAIVVALSLAATSFVVSREALKASGQPNLTTQVIIIFGWSGVNREMANDYVHDAIATVRTLPPETLLTVSSAYEDGSTPPCPTARIPLSDESRNDEAALEYYARARAEATVRIQQQLACYSPSSPQMDLLRSLQDSVEKGDQPPFQATRIFVYSQGRQFSNEIRLTKSVLTDPKKLQREIDKLSTENLLFPPVVGGDFSITNPQPNRSLSEAEVPGIIRFWEEYSVQSQLRFSLSTQSRS
jgi:hypothetical protein